MIVPRRRDLGGDVLVQADGAGGGLQVQPRPADIRAQTLILTDFHHFMARFHTERKSIFKSSNYIHPSTPKTTQHFDVDLLEAVGVAVGEALHGDERILTKDDGCYPFSNIQMKHLLQQIYKVLPVFNFCHGVLI